MWLHFPKLLNSICIELGFTCLLQSTTPGIRDGNQTPIVLSVLRSKMSLKKLFKSYQLLKRAAITTWDLQSDLLYNIYSMIRWFQVGLCQVLVYFIQQKVLYSCLFRQNNFWKFCQDEKTTHLCFRYWQVLYQHYYQKNSGIITITNVHNKWSWDDGRMDIKGLTMGP